MGNAHITFHPFLQLYSMKRLLTATAILLFLAAGIFLACNVFTNRQKVLYDQLSLATNLQTDVLAPFVQKHGLARTIPNDTERTNFSAFLQAQVAAGRIGANDAKTLLEEIQRSGLESPVFTQRGWVMTIIATTP